MSHKQPFNESYWQDHYQETSSMQDKGVLPASPYLHLSEIANLAPGKALDAGCGEGADAIWLAKQGWEVRAVDISSIALDRAREIASAVAAPVKFEQADLTTWTPEKNHYDFVISQYVHTTDNRKTINSLAEAVKPGGTLLIVGHQPPESHAQDHHGHHAEGSHVTADEIAAQLNPIEWEVQIAGPRTTERTTPNGQTVQLYDSLLLARKRMESATQNS